MSILTNYNLQLSLPEDGDTDWGENKLNVVLNDLDNKLSNGLVDILGNANKIKGKQINITGIQDGDLLVFNNNTDKFEPVNIYSENKIYFVDDYSSTVNQIKIVVNEITTLADGQLFNIKLKNSNTLAVTIQVNSITAKPLKKNAWQEVLVANDLLINARCLCVYNYTKDVFELLSVIHT